MNIRHRFAKIVLSALVASSLAACGGAERQSSIVADQGKLTAATEQGDFNALMAEADAAWANRLDKAQLQLAIDKWEAAAKTATPDLTPEQRAAKLAEIFETLSRAYYFLGDSHIRLEGKDDEMNDAMMATFEKGVTASEKAIALRDPDFAAKVAADRNNWKSAVSTAKKEALPALYWYSTNLGKWALLEGIATILSRKDDIKATMDWVVANDATYFYAAPYRYFGAFHTKVPIGGGNPKASLEAFDKSIEIAPNYLATKVLKAEQYAVLIGDRDLYESLLNEVLNADLSLAPEIAPENELEKRKAKRMLADADEFFY
ncbi:MAG: TRAP transporter TatT component family protein [bacterium]